MEIRYYVLCPIQGNEKELHFSTYEEAEAWILSNKPKFATIEKRYILVE